MHLMMYTSLIILLLLLENVTSTKSHWSKKNLTETVRENLIWTDGTHLTDTDTDSDTKC